MFLAVSHSKNQKNMYKFCTVCCEMGYSSTTFCQEHEDICDYCMKSYIENNIRKHGIRCPHQNCKNTLDESKIVSLLNRLNSKWKDLRDELLVDYILMNEPLYFKCAHGCGAGFILPSAMERVNCMKCHKSTCFRHKVPWHNNMTCQEYEMQREKDSDRYINNYAKVCPLCKAPIQKENEKDCDRMECVCGHRFCFFCGADYDTILREGNHYHMPFCRFYFPIES